MALRKNESSGNTPSMNMKPLSFSINGNGKGQLSDPERRAVEADVDIDLREVYFLIMHFLSAGPCHRTYGQFWNELLEHELLPRRYHAWYSRSGVHSGDENDDGLSFPLSYNKLVERYPHIDKDHLVKLLKQLLLSTAAPSRARVGGNALNAAAVPTLLGTGSFSLLGYAQNKSKTEVKPPPYMRWPHRQADQVRGLSLREIGGGFGRHHRAPAVRAACYAIAKPSTMVQKMQNIKKLRGHRNAVYCAIFDRSGRYVITGSDDRLVKIWSMETAYCLASCRGHEGDITDLSVSSNNTLVASASNDCIIRVWRLPDGLPISVLRGHTGAVTAIAFSPRPSSVYQLLSSSDDGTCRIWDARYSQFSPRVYVPRPPDPTAGKNNGQSSSVGHQSHQIFCCAFNANGTVFVTGSSDTLARVWNACKSNADDSEQPNHEMDVLAGHENDVNYVQFSGCAVASRMVVADVSKEDNLPKFKNTWFTHDNIVTCSRDGSAIIWVPRSRRSHSRVGRWTRAYHLKVPPPPVPPQPLRGGPRQRILPTPRGVNMIVWSLDNRFVLAAIMDCRICVWNAVDGSLVHSLTGHSDSTYVLDVHPFNPRIAMSAGYDGKTILWDIWEGTPIRIYEIGRFKLVDGKFSPDGTSIILSDDVGQLYVLSTGQGESQKDAKYDQFFLGDYRPLVQDMHGNVLDQETQLAPHRRNLQDLLCDSSMIPYPEPYQSMYQQRRLGALGIEWRPSSVRFAIGEQGSVDPDYPAILEPDLDILIDPLPEFVDAMDWEPEIELHSDDNDSEYNLMEENSSGRDQGGLSSNSSGDPECSAEDSEVEDGLRRSKRKKKKADVEIMTSSGRRVKRRNLDDPEESSIKNQQVRKPRNERKASRRKSSSSKSLRPQRAAARNALTLFSRITGTPTDGEDEEDSSECDLSESESALQDLNVDTEESDGHLQNELGEHSKGKELLMDEVEVVDKRLECSESHVVDAGKGKKLVLKRPVHDVKKLDIDPDPRSSSSKAPYEDIEPNRNYSRDPEHLSGDGKCNETQRSEERGLPVKIEHHLDLFEGYNGGKIRWGGVRARTSKRPKMGETLPPNSGSSTYGDGGSKIESLVNRHPLIEEEDGKTYPSLATQNSASQIDNGIPLDSDGARNGKGHSRYDELTDYDEPLNTDHATTSPVPHNNHESQTLHELIANSTRIPTMLTMTSERNSRNDRSCSELKIKSSVEDLRNGGSDIVSGSPSDPEHEQNTKSEVPSSHHGEQNGTLKVEVEIDRTSGPVLRDPPKSNSIDRMYNAVYRRSKSIRATNKPEGESGTTGACTSSASNHNVDVGVTTDGIRRTRSMGLCAPISDTNVISNNVNLKERSTSDDTSTSVEKSPINGYNEPPREEWGSGSRVTVGLRSTRNRRSSYHIRDTSPPERRKPHQTAGNSWLMLSTHEEGSRYIPQLGDEVVYLRQGHQEYIGYSNSRDVGPWRTTKGNIRAVEFCRVEGLDYSTHPGSGESCCKMTLEFVDPSSAVAGKSFKLTLPKVTNFPDFLVERTRYDAAIQRNWTSRDKCRVWWENEGEENGSWWNGRILSVKPKSPEFPESPWERYLVQYKSDPRETHLHGPWELYDDRTRWEQPRIDDEIRDKLLRSFAKLEESGNRVQDHYGVQKLKQVSQKSNFVNRFPVPLSLDLIQARLESNYYRSLKAVKHDITLMLSNAESYFGRNVELSVKIKRLSEWFTRTLSSL